MKTAAKLNRKAIKMQATAKTRGRTKKPVILPPPNETEIIPNY